MKNNYSQNGTRRMSWFHRHKPSAACSTHILVAALVWSGVGLMLLTRGLVNLWHIGPKAFWSLPLFLLLGFFKGKVVLKKSAQKNVDRIKNRPEGRYCIGGFMPWKAWLLVAAMIALGRLLRSSPLPPTLIWGIYAAIGVALSVGSVNLWKSWLSFKRRQ